MVSTFPYGLAVRIPGFHPGGPGSTPGMGRKYVFFFFNYLVTLPKNFSRLLQNVRYCAKTGCPILGKLFLFFCCLFLLISHQQQTNKPKRISGKECDRLFKIVS